MKTHYSIQSMYENGEVLNGLSDSKFWVVWVKSELQHLDQGVEKNAPKRYVLSLQLCLTPWTVACQAVLSMRILQARILEWVAISFFRGSSQGLNQCLLCLLHWQVGYLSLEPPGKPMLKIPLPKISLSAEW